ncbi:MAG: AAA family ATPase, partial [Anaerolineales bacterium]|nr:AAA family ATPase [Anaerolineales bacterium]
MTQHRITDDLDAMLDVLPTNIRHAVEKANNSDNLLEIVIDLGRVPTARFVEGEIVLSEKEITRGDIDHITERIGTFDADNRAGMERTLHRISAIRNRLGAIVGLTCRVGRAVYGTVDIIQDIIESGKSVLILGRPGVGKTTLLREAARILAENKRVVIVDTSNEIGGDGDVPHPAVGKARRMQVREPMLQHEVMIEAVENHNPEVIVIDEIGRELETLAARTIAERGVQLIGTAHGQTLENLLLNPTLSDLVGGIEAVTLSDEEARRRGTQKTVLERRAPPTFDVLIEIQHRERFAVHIDIMSAVDSLLRDVPTPSEIRTRDEAGQIQIEKAAPIKSRRPERSAEGKPEATKTPRRTRIAAPVIEEQNLRSESINPLVIVTPNIGAKLQSVRVFAYGVARNRLMQAAKRLGVPAMVVADVNEADVLVTLRTYY